MYIKLALIFSPWRVPNCAAGITAALTAKPEIISQLPQGAIANCYTEQLKSLMTKQLVFANYYQDCNTLTEEQINSVLEQFKAHYNNYEEGLPGVILTGNLPRNNEIIVNMEIAIKNILQEEQGCLLSKLSRNCGEELLEEQKSYTC